mmetsp:Transcript_28367/g.51213  ORF Transcript_28367/g.51213 Transcript_28367/m.51213 type:complete len:244 (+) Transcript_28367:581-1312(+)
MNHGPVALTPLELRWTVWKKPVQAHCLIVYQACPVGNVSNEVLRVFCYSFLGVGLCISIIVCKGICPGIIFGIVDQLYAVQLNISYTLKDLRNQMSAEACRLAHAPSQDADSSANSGPYWTPNHGSSGCTACCSTSCTTNVLTGLPATLSINSTEDATKKLFTENLAHCSCASHSSPTSTRRELLHTFCATFGSTFCCHLPHKLFHANINALLHELAPGLLDSHASQVPCSCCTSTAVTARQV